MSLKLHLDDNCTSIRKLYLQEALVGFYNDMNEDETLPRRYKLPVSCLGNFLLTCENRLNAYSHKFKILLK